MTSLLTYYSHILSTDCLKKVELISICLPAFLLPFLITLVSITLASFNLSCTFVFYSSVFILKMLCRTRISTCIFRIWGFFFFMKALFISFTTKHVTTLGYFERYVLFINLLIIKNNLSALMGIWYDPICLCQIFWLLRNLISASIIL